MRIGRSIVGTVVAAALAFAVLVGNAPRPVQAATAHAVPVQSPSPAPLSPAELGAVSGDGWFGAIVGAVVGAIEGGVVGAIIGGTIGYFSDTICVTQPDGSTTCADS